MAPRIFICADLERVTGPFYTDELRKLAQEQAVTEATLACQESTETWLPLGDLCPEIFANTISENLETGNASPEPELTPNESATQATARAPASSKTPPSGFPANVENREAVGSASQEGSHEPLRRKFSKSGVFRVVLAGGLIVVALLGALAWNSVQTTRERLTAENDLQAVSKYREKLESGMKMMTATYPSCVDICSRHSKAWKMEIETGGTWLGSSRVGVDPSKAVSNSVTENMEPIIMFESVQAVVQKGMSELSSPPQGFEAAHAKLVSVYGTFGDLVSLASSPSGSLMSYNEKVNRIESELQRGLNELKVLIPPKQISDAQP